MKTVEDLKIGDLVIFRTYYQAGGEVFITDGRVLDIYDEDVSITYFYGYRCVTDTVSKNELIALYDEVNGVNMTILNISGPSIILNKELLDEVNGGQYE